MFRAQSTSLQTTQKFSIKSLYPEGLEQEVASFIPTKESQNPISQKKIFGWKFCAEIKRPEMIEEDTKELEFGVTFENDLKFEMHVANKLNIANKIFGLIRRITKS